MIHVCAVLSGLKTASTTIRYRSGLSLMFYSSSTLTFTPSAIREAVRARVWRGHRPPRGALHQEEDGAEPRLPGECGRPFTASDVTGRSALDRFNAGMSFFFVRDVVKIRLWDF